MRTPGTGPQEKPEAPLAAGPCPCGGCRYAARCGRVGLACAAFAMFVSGEGEPRWSKAPRVPSDAIYRVLFEGGPPVGGGRPRGPAKPARAPDTGHRYGPGGWLDARLRHVRVMRG